MTAIQLGWALSGRSQGNTTRDTFLNKVDEGFKIIDGHFGSAWFTDHLQYDASPVLEGWTTLTLCWLHKISTEKIESFPLQFSVFLTTDMLMESGLGECSYNPGQKLTNHDTNVSLICSLNPGKRQETAY